LFRSLVVRRQSSHRAIERVGRGVQGRRLSVSTEHAPGSEPARRPSCVLPQQTQLPEVLVLGKEQPRSAAASAMTCSSSAPLIASVMATTSWPAARRPTTRVKSQLSSATSRTTPAPGLISGGQNDLLVRDGIGGIER